MKIPKLLITAGTLGLAACATYSSAPPPPRAEPSRPSEAPSSTSPFAPPSEPSSSPSYQSPSPSPVPPADQPDEEPQPTRRGLFGR